MTPCLWHTHDCKFEEISPAGFRILSALYHAVHWIERDLVITAGTNDHSIGMHPIGSAFDIRTRTLTTPLVLKLIEFLREELGPDFTVLYESPTKPDDAQLAAIVTINPHASAGHCHVQLRKGLTYPPKDDGALV